MQGTTQIAATLLVALAASIASAGDAAPGERAEWQLSVWGGQQNLRVDHDLHFRDETHRQDQWLNGISIARRLPQGFLVEAAAETAYHDSSLGKDNDFSVDHYSVALGWQIDAERWRFTPKLGLARSQLGNQARLLLNQNGGRVFERDYTVPYAELDLQRRFGRHFQLGGAFRDTDEEFGHTRSWAFMMTLLW
jgi:hypothetical protein